MYAFFPALSCAEHLPFFLSWDLFLLVTLWNVTSSTGLATWRVFIGQVWLDLDSVFVQLVDNSVANLVKSHGIGPKPEFKSDKLD